jgi:hypothetical protein
MNRVAARARWAAVALAFAFCGAAAAAETQPPAPVLFAGRIETSNIARWQRAGPDATGGLGDWAVSNGELCAVVTDPSHESDLSDQGGSLVDLGRCGVADDQFVLLQPLANLSREGILPVDEIRSETGPGEAKIIGQGQRDGLAFEMTYAVDRERPRRLRIVSRLTRVGKGPALRAFGDVVVQSDRALQPFTLSLARPEQSRGFVHPDLDLDSALSVARATHEGDLHVLVGAEGTLPGVSYGLHLVGARVEKPGGGSRPAPMLVLAAESFSGFAAFPRPFWLGAPKKLGAFQLLQLPFMDLAPGETLVVERELWVGERSDVASVTDALFANAAPVSGSVSDAAARIHVDRDDGVPLTQVRPDAEGRFSLRLPPGRYRARALAPGGREGTAAFEVVGAEATTGAATEIPPLALAGPALVTLPQGTPMRLVFVGAEGTPEPAFGDALLGLRYGERAAESSTRGRDIHLSGSSGSASDPRSVTLPPGRYQVLATRGPEFGVTRTTLTLAPGQHVALEIAAPPRVLETPGWISADFHVHAAPSDDSALPLERRVASFVAEGDEVLVATDHDHVTDYGPLVRELDLAGQIATIVGQEVTSNTKSKAAPYSFGHVNVFPLPYRPELYRKGALPNEGRRLRDVLASVRAIAGERVVQLNHAREPTPDRKPQALFTHLSVPGEPYDPTRPLTDPPNAVLLEADRTTGLRDLDFDVMELLNGPSLARYRALREDWFSLLRQGIVRTATANSDTHRLGEVAAAPRNYVRVEHDTVAGFDEAALVRALLAGRVFGTTGPILDVALGDAGPGDRFEGSTGTLRVRADAAPWVPISSVRVFVNGKLADERGLERGVAVDLPLQLPRDAFVTVEVEGVPDATYATVLPGFTPFAFSNPIFVDADGDGRFTPEAPLGAATAPGKNP